MKRIFVLMISFLLLVACSSTATEEQKEQEDTEKNTEAEEAANSEEESGIEVDKGLLHVDITIPSSLFDEEELEEIEREMKEERNSDVTKNDDGSLTIKIPKKEHKELLAEMKDHFIDSINDLIEDDDFASIQDVEYNKNFTEFKMIVQQEEFEDGFDGFATMSIGIASLLYQAFDGKDLEKEKVKILLENEETKEVFQEVIYPDVLDEMEEGLE